MYSRMLTVIEYVYVFEDAYCNSMICMYLRMVSVLEYDVLTIECIENKSVFKELWICFV